MTHFGCGLQNWSKKSEFAEKSDLIGPNGYSFGYVGTLSIRNQLKYTRHQNLCSPVLSYPSVQVKKSQSALYSIIFWVKITKYQVRYLMFEDTFLNIVCCIIEYLYLIVYFIHFYAIFQKSINEHNDKQKININCLKP